MHEIGCVILIVVFCVPSTWLVHHSRATAQWHWTSIS